MNSKKTVVVLFGGQSSEHDVSRISASTIIKNMDPNKYFVLTVGITKEGKWMLYNGPVNHIETGEWEKFATPAFISPDATQKALIKFAGDRYKTIPIDVVFPVLHGLYGEDGTVQGLLEMAQIPYVGCGVLASSVSMDKVYTKMIVEKENIAQAKYLVIYKEDLNDIEPIVSKVNEKIGYPCFIKPSNAGSSIGITKAHNQEELINGLHIAAKHDRKILVEEAIVGREVECAVLGNLEVKASSVGEIIAAAEFYDYDAKYNNSESKTIINPDIPTEIAEEIREKSVRIFKAVDGSGLSRVDFFIEKDTNRVIFNEINTMPGFTSISMYPMLWENAGIPIGKLIDTLIELAIERVQNK
ncbi:MAG TPA: D-alanine--D-alanine ligase family protein [Defluviitaleaceae bacterium]|jgi:D-alanine-D-alanine ligase|nr:D-alanine--D-alanine ligase [Candidatus Epulonipiscium sp.]HOQ17798.1 D-alanine--D-alanine ligase family protein [Defluviitaleaceae bacterium]HPT77307.1 D-alanine--D-alanine ligase family protein [Defluviitaleaceae bacterium]HQD51211.1 D-alanine--D-alanine ligase family protein [Defluviitaleaceae bacterium]